MASGGVGIVFRDGGEALEEGAHLEAMLVDRPPAVGADAVFEQRVHHDGRVHAVGVFVLAPADAVDAELVGVGVVEAFVVVELVSGSLGGGPGA